EWLLTAAMMRFPPLRLCPKRGRGEPGAQPKSRGLNGPNAIMPAPERGDLEADGFAVFPCLDGWTEGRSAGGVAQRDVALPSPRTSVPVVPGAAGGGLPAGMDSTGDRVVVPGNGSGGRRPRAGGIRGGVSGGVLVPPGRADSRLCD